MIVLSIDSTAVVASAAVCEFDDGRLKSYSLCTLKNGLTHSENLLPMIDSALKLFGRSTDDLQLIAISAGPGSFTGVRIGIATVKGLVFEKDIPVCGISALEAIAENCSGMYGIICPVMDARRGQFYNALFENGNRITEDRCITADSLIPELDTSEKNVIICGDGSQLFKSFCTDKMNIKIAPYIALDQNALSVALCGYRKHLSGGSVSGQELAPVYLRMPQAERERMEKLENSVGK